MPRFLHTADWQIGRQFASFDPEHAPILAEARIKAVAALARLAAEQRVDAVLVAGDVFDAQTVSERTIRRLFNALGAFQGPWLMISGNHDAALAESVWTHAQRLGVVPPHVHLLLQPEVRVFAELGFAVLPAPLMQRHTYDDATEWFDSADTPAGLLRVGLAHGCVQGLLLEDLDSPNPIAPDRCERARLDYLALGDWHGTRVLHPRMAYSGTPEPDRFKSNDAGQALLVDIAGPGSKPVVTPVRIAQFDWQTLAHDCQVESDVAQLLQVLQGITAGAVVKLQLSGVVTLAAQHALQQALAAAGARARHLQVDLSALRLAPSDEDIASLEVDGYLAELIAELREAMATGADAGLAQECLALLAGALRERAPAREARA